MPWWPPFCNHRTVASMQAPNHTESRIKNIPLLLFHVDFQAGCGGGVSVSSECEGGGDIFEA